VKTYTLHTLPLNGAHAMKTRVIGRFPSIGRRAKPRV